MRDFCQLFFRNFILRDSNYLILIHQNYAILFCHVTNFRCFKCPKKCFFCKIHHKKLGCFLKELYTVKMVVIFLNNRKSLYKKKHRFKLTCISCNFRIFYVIFLFFNQILQDISCNLIKKEKNPVKYSKMTWNTC